MKLLARLPERWSNAPLAIVGAVALLLLAGIGYYFLTQDTPEGNFKDLRREGRMPAVASTRGGFPPG